MAAEPAIRAEVPYRHDAINPEFLQFLAEIAGYAGDKYGNPLQYLGSRLAGGRGPVNHARNHIGEYQRGVEHDHFGPDPRWHLAAAAYNLMMEFTYVSRGEAPDVWPRSFSAVPEKPSVSKLSQRWLTSRDTDYGLRGCVARLCIWVTMARQHGLFHRHHWDHTCSKCCPKGV